MINLAEEKKNLEAQMQDLCVAITHCTNQGMYSTVRNYASELLFLSAKAELIDHLLRSRK